MRWVTCRIYSFWRFGLVHGKNTWIFNKGTVVVTVFGEADVFHALTDSRIHGWLSLGRSRPWNSIGAPELAGGDVTVSCRASEMR